jgi:hypothetical protein
MVLAHRLMRLDESGDDDWPLLHRVFSLRWQF